MGYTKIIQYAEFTEIYDYSKNYITPRPRPPRTAIQKKRDKERRKVGIARSPYSAKRARNDFFRLVCHNLHSRGAPALLTLTMAEQSISLSEGYRFIAKFKENVKNSLGETISYFAVPEWQKSGRLHYHLIAWGLSESVIRNERFNRNLQRLYSRGYLDVRLARDASPKLASYLAKYMSKAYTDKRLSGRKAYTSTRDVDKIRKAGSNSLSSYLNDIVDLSTPCISTKTYDTLWLGQCVVTKYKK